MGNCSSNRVRTWVDDEDWDSPEEKTDRRGEGKATRTLENLKGERGGLSSTVVKIKITRKQLQELLRRADTQGLLAPRHALLADVVSRGVVGHARRSRKWRPRLQRIPEVAEHDEIDT